MSLFQNARFRALALTALAASFCVPFAAHAQTSTNDVENTLVTFDGANGRLPESNLILANDGNYYGVTFYGGEYGQGTIFRLTPTGSPITAFTETVVYSFPGSSSTTSGGVNPQGGLIQGTDGYLYGTTYSDLANSSGTIFQFNIATQTLNTLHTFTGSSVTPSDGKHPEASLIEGVDGYLYGTTHGGSGVEAITNGAIFRIAKGYPSTGYEIIHSCTTGTTLDCNSPIQPLVQGSNGDLYGTSYTGGANSLGDVFKIAISGSNYTYTELLSFSSAITSPSTPYSGLVVGTNGTTLYGVTYAGGANADGALYSLVDSGTTGTATLLYSFAGKSSPGKPEGMILGSDGLFYGTSEAAGGNSGGTVWNSTVQGTVTMLYPFNYVNTPSDGSTPVGNPIIGADGYIYGTASAGGTAAYGTVWQVVPAATLPAPINISLSTTSIALGSSTTLSYSSPLAYGETNSQCFATSVDPEWTGVKTIKTTATTLTLKPTAAGTYVYAITCGGTQSASATLKVTGGTTKTNTTTVYSPSSNPTYLGNNLTLSATVTGTSGIPTGTVSFYLGTSSLLTATLSNGTGSVTFSTASLPAGSYPLYAVYSGDSNNNASTSATVTTTLNQNTTSTVLTVSPNPVSGTGTTTFTANVTRTSSGAGEPTGSVGFYFGTSELISAAVNGQGVASVTVPVSGVPAGTYNITATYLGDSADATSTSTAVPVTVN